MGPPTDATNVRDGRREACALAGARAPMPSRKHQALAQLLLDHPELLVELVRRNHGVQLPDDLELVRGPETVRLGYADRIADGVVVFRRRHRGSQETIVLEVQLRRDPRKRKAWAIYVVGTWAQLDCPTTLVVVTDSPRVARWASEPIDLGHARMVLRPLVIGPEQIDAEPTLEQARARPERLALSVLVHGDKTGSLGLARVALTVANELLASRDERRMVLGDLIVSFVAPRVRRSAEAKMDVSKYVWFTEQGKAYGRMRAKAVAEGLAKGEAKGLAKGLAKGQAEGLSRGRTEGQCAGLARGLWTVLRGRGLEPTEAQRARIERCRDARRLETWLARAVVAESMAEVLRR